jgi:cyclopropane fatty-acyl-phospholipid synthase-like methyltransferase
MKMHILTEPTEVEAAWKNQYGILATDFAKRLENRSGKIAEIGCGSGRLTVPLMKLLGKSQFVLVDRFADTKTGSYSKSYEMLTSNLKTSDLTNRADVVISDYLEWVRGQRDGAYDGVISCEFLPEITMHGMNCFIRECFRLLVLGGFTVHCFLSPTPRNSRQRLVITADTDPTWTRTPPEEWFSPKPNLVMSELRKAGFSHASKTAFMSHLVLREKAAKSELKRWNVRPSFYEKYRKSLDKDGLEIPDWIIIAAEKPL